jgi:hypothetical protein
VQESEERRFLSLARRLRVLRFMRSTPLTDKVVESLEFRRSIQYSLGINRRLLESFIRQISSHPYSNHQFIYYSRLINTLSDFCIKNINIAKFP